MSVELDALQEVFQEATDKHLFVRQRGASFIARHRLEVTCASSKIFIHFLSRFGCTCLLQAAQEETGKDCFRVEIIRLPLLPVGAKVEDGRVVGRHVLVLLAKPGVRTRELVLVLHKVFHRLLGD